MIEISLGLAATIYGGIIALGALLLWLYTEVATQRGYQVLEKQHLWRCIYCAYVYLDDSGHSVSSCPRCKSLNDERDRGVRFVRAVRRKVAEAPAPAMPPSRRNPSHRKRPGARHRGPRRRR